MQGQQGTSWVQDLDKKGVIAELKKRGIECSTSNKFDELRELLRKIVKREIAEAVGKDGKESTKISKRSESDDSSYSDAASNETATDSDESNMASDSIRLEFCLHKDNWENFVERLELYFTAKDIKEEKQAAHLLTRLDEEAFSLMKQLVAPDKLNTKKFNDLVTIMTGHLNPKPSEIMERCKFNVAKQEANESVAEFTTRLKKNGNALQFRKYKSSGKDGAEPMFVDLTVNGTKNV
ncbi:uncharacterized protein LOC143894883 [Temnothorax americanus]|uniref:uncharacterized protein LOC143894883 n=1 Tax=Temnothorax americanus TaxID=1964332 RepID=UPI004069814E